MTESLLTLRGLCVLGVSAVETLENSITAETQRTLRWRRGLQNRAPPTACRVAKAN